MHLIGSQMSWNAEKRAVRRTWNRYRKIPIKMASEQQVSHERAQRGLHGLNAVTPSGCFLLHKTDQVFRLEVGKLKGPLAKPLSKICRYGGLSVIDRPGGKRTFLTQEIAELLNNEFHLGLRCVHRRYAAFLGASSLHSAQ